MAENRPVIAKLAGESSFFVVTTSTEKPDKETRKRIRSHVMKGKNRRAPRAKAGSWINGHDAQRCDAADTVEIRVALPGLRGAFDGTGLSVSHFAVDMQPYMLDLVFKCECHSRQCRKSNLSKLGCLRPISTLHFMILKVIDHSIVFTVIKESLYPIELCVMFEPKNSIWFEYLHFDAMYLHSLMWTSQEYFDQFEGSGKSRAGMIHKAKALHLLQTRLTDPVKATSDTTISVVVTLVLLTTLHGDLKTARQHMDGLHKIVMIRGGLRALKDNDQIQTKACRADLALALSCGTKPMFFSEGISWEPIFPALNGRRPRLPTQFSALDIDTRLQNIVGDLHLFCTSANVAFQTGQKIDPNVFQEVLISVQYRLMVLDLRKYGFLETLRLGILAFSTTVFLQTNGIRCRFDNLSRQLQESICQRDLVGSSSSLDEAWLWVLFITTAAAVTNEDDHWLMPLIKAALLKTQTATWEGARIVLKSILWIDSLHDKDGRRVFDQALQQNN